MAAEKPETVLVELMVRIEGSEVTNRITAFEMPIVGRTEGTEDEPGQVQFESRVLVNHIVKAVRRLV